jgi:MOSC domain-containing protein YiiM
MASVPGRVVSVNLAQIRTLRRRGELVETGIWKLPAKGRVAVGTEGLAGDRQADRRVHGGPDLAVYAYASEDYAWWEQELRKPLPPGTFGENLTLEGIDVTDALVGERWSVGTALLEVTSPRTPCWKLAAKMEDQRFVKRFAKARRPGGYLRVIEPGAIEAGDQVAVVERPEHGITIRMVATAYLDDHSLAGRILEAPQLADAWRSWAEKRVAAA